MMLENTPDVDTMRAQVYEFERKRLEQKMRESNVHLESIRQQEKKDGAEAEHARGEVALILATQRELEKKIKILDAQYQHGR